MEDNKEYVNWAIKMSEIMIGMVGKRGLQTPMKRVKACGQFYKKNRNM
jgi:hypothetical protein